jgi:hypothetical protein
MFNLLGSPRCLLLPLAVVALLSPTAGRAEERHYLIIFAAQSHPKIPRLTHTFATLVKVTDGLPDCPSSAIEAYTISWLPQTLKVRPYRLHDEPGRNLTLLETLDWAYGNHMHVSQWGPYAIEPDFFQLVYHEYARIENGEFRYKAIDPNQRGVRTTDCIHAITDIDRDDGRTQFPEWRSGEPVTRKFVRVLHDRGRLLDPLADMSWLNTALGLDRYPIIHRPNP